MPSITPFLPPDLLHPLPESGRLPHVEESPAALLISDISGFTALTERLQSTGRRGAEEVGELLNRAFRPAIRAIEESGGSVVSFGGDALFATFSGRSAVSRAHTAAQRIQASPSRHRGFASSVGRVELRIAQALHWGRVRRVHLGHSKRRHYLVGGRAVEATARMEKRAEPGEILVSIAARAVMKNEPPPRRATARRRVAPPGLVDYLDPLMASALKGFRGEYRRVALLFLETRGCRPPELQEYFETLAEVLDTYQGLLLKSDPSTEGHRWMIAFGLPIAQERDVDRAARAALDALESAPRSLAVRGGLNAGTVVNIMFGSRSRHGFDVLGDVVNTAARALESASWGEVLSCEPARARLSAARTRSRGRRRVRGKRKALGLHSLEAGTAPRRSGRSSAPMIGREAPLAGILEDLEQARAGSGRVIEVVGETGVGKSRLRQAVVQRASRLGFSVHQGRGASFGAGAYRAVGELVGAALSLPGESPSRFGVAEAARRLGLERVDQRHLGRVLGVALPRSQADQLRSEDLERNDAIAVVEALQRLARERPRLLVIEDAQWLDRSSRTVLDRLSASISAHPIALCVLLRPEESWGPLPGSRRLSLEPLSAAEIRRLLEGRFGEIDDELLQLMSARTDGNPLYVEELAHHLIETGRMVRTKSRWRLRGDGDVDDVPGSLEAILSARLDRLPLSGRRVAQAASVVGRRFDRALLQRVVPGAAVAGLEALLAHGIVRADPDRTSQYSFRHALTRDVAYRTILQSRRRRLHHAIAVTLGQSKPSTPSELGAVGHHWEQAGDRERARGLYRRASSAAVESFHQEAVVHWCRCHSRVSEDVDAEWVESRRRLGSALLNMGRVDEAEIELRRSLERAESLGLVGDTISGLCAVGSLLRRTGRPVEARPPLEEAVAVAREACDRVGLGEALQFLANLERELDLPDRAEAHYREAARLLRRRPRMLGQVYGNLAGLCRERGRPAESRRYFNQSLRLLRRLGHRRLEAVFLGNLAGLDFDEGRLSQARRRYRAALLVLEPIGDRAFEGFMSANLATIEIMTGNYAEAELLLGRARARHEATGNVFWLGVTLYYEGALRAKTDRLPEALETLGSALRHVKSVNSVRFEGIIRIQRADCLEKIGDLEQAREELSMVLAGRRAAPRVRASAQMRLSRLDRWEGQNLASAERRTMNAVRTLRRVGDPFELAKGVAELGHLRLAQGRSAARLIRANREVLEKEAEHRDCLLAAQRALDAGEPLLRGYRPEDVGEALRVRISG